MSLDNRDNPIRSWLEQRLQQITDDLAAGRDVSPARRFRLEGAIECWARQQEMDTHQLRDWLMNSGVSAQVEGHEVFLCLPMRRAPVRPTTSD